MQWAVSDNHEGLKKALSETLPQAAWQRCYVHFLRNAVDHLPRKADDDCLTELRWLYDRRDLQEARRDLHSWIERWADRYPKLCTWVEDNIEETFTFYRLPRAHRKHLKSTNMLERLNHPNSYTRSAETSKIFGLTRLGYSIILRCSALAEQPFDVDRAFEDAKLEKTFPG